MRSNKDRAQPKKKEGDGSSPPHETDQKSEQVRGQARLAREGAEAHGGQEPAGVAEERRCWCRRVFQGNCVGKAARNGGAETRGIFFAKARDARAGLFNDGGDPTEQGKTMMQERGCQVQEWKPRGRGPGTGGGQGPSSSGAGLAGGKGTDGGRLFRGRQARVLLLTASNFSMKTFPGRCWGGGHVGKADGSRRILQREQDKALEEWEPGRAGEVW